MMAVIIAALLAAQVTGASAKRDNAELTVLVEADGMIDAGRVTARIESRAVVLVLPATLESSKRTFHVAHRYLQARREGTNVELEVPIGSKVSCSGPVTVAQVSGGLEARVRCAETSETKAQETSETKAVAPAPGAVRVESAAPKAEPVAVKAEPVAAKAESVAVKVAPAAKAEPIAPKAEPVATVAIKGEPVAAKVDPAQSLFETSAPKPQLDLSDKKSSPIGPAAGALAVVGLGAAAYFLRNQKKRKASHIEVLETAALGPKRALVLARVGGKTLLLASSEAGITLLENVGELALPMLSEEPAPEPALLSTLRAYTQPKLPSKAADPFSKLSKYLKPAPAPEFDALFAEEQEDQELRMKLLAGQSARAQ